MTSQKTRRTGPHCKGNITPTRKTSLIAEDDQSSEGRRGKRLQPNIFSGEGRGDWGGGGGGRGVHCVSERDD